MCIYTTCNIHNHTLSNCLYNSIHVLNIYIFFKFFKLLNDNEIERFFFEVIFYIFAHYFNFFGDKIFRQSIQINAEILALFIGLLLKKYSLEYIECMQDLRGGRKADNCLVTQHPSACLERKNI